ncbi:MAG TPA: AIR synthase-related protein, partial [Alphaproteobacteria bacterium]|nr:AIR synthase-related protein [Alphaproteobacteria bacterium]
ELDLDKVPVRETGMTAYEIMLSESQERMLMILKPQAMDKARAIFEKWELDFAEIGRLTDTGHLVLKKNGRVEADMPVAPLVEKSPVYERPWVPTKPQAELAANSVPAPKDLLAALKQLVGSPDLSSRRWVWEQYDHLVMGHTAQRPGGDAAVVRLPDMNGKALAITSDCTPRYCYADPKRGGAQAVAETWRNLTAVGAKPLAITDNMNFGNPQRPEIMGQFVGCIEGMAEACKALDYPVISGNVSLYNETNGKGILPTPVIGGVGVIADAAKSVPVAFRQAGEIILLVGETKGHLGQSIYVRELHGREEGAPPPVDLAAEKRNGDFVRAQIAAGSVTACHDCSDGGLLVAVAEMAMAGNLGASLSNPENSIPSHAFWFGEDQARYVLTVKAASADKVLSAAKAAGVPAAKLGETGGAALNVAGTGAISVSDLKAAHEAFFPKLMSTEM